MNKDHQMNAGRRDFLKKNLALFSGVAAALAAQAFSFPWKGAKQGSGLSMKPGRFYKKLAG